MNLTTGRGEPSRDVVKGKLMLNLNMLKRLFMGRGKINYEFLGAIIKVRSSMLKESLCVSVRLAQRSIKVSQSSSLSQVSLGSFSHHF